MLLLRVFPGAWYFYILFIHVSLCLGKVSYSQESEQLIKNTGYNERREDD